jgi:hypothetical protein
MRTPAGFVMLAAATLLARGVGATGANDKPKQWSVQSGDNYQLLYMPGHENDAKKVKGFLDSGIASLKKEFAGLQVDELLRVNCAIYLHPKGSGKASESSAGITSGTDGQGKYFAVIDLLAPSAYDPGYRSNVNEPPGDDHYFKLVIHEYSTILLDRITRDKKGGWSFFSAPRWFTDGYEEYLGLMLSSPRNRKEVLMKYLAMHRQDPDRIDFDFGVSVKDDYIDGAVLLLFMHETFGKDRVHAILKSEERRFGRAMASALGVGLDGFKKRWDEWLKRKLTGQR